MKVSDDIYKENDNTYVTISFTNQNTFGVEQNLSYDVTKTMAIVDNASHYYAAITRFDIPLTSIPITIFPVQKGQSDPNLSTLQVGVQLSPMTAPEYIYLQYVPQNLTPPPVQDNPNQQIITFYYYVFSYTQMITMINTALQTAYSAAGLVDTAPYFVYDSATNLISLIVGAEFNVIDGPSVIINYPLFQYLNGFDITGLGNGYYSFNFYGVLNESYGYAIYGTAPTDPPTFYKLTQEYINLGGWNPIRKILFITNTIPIKNEIVPCNQISQNNEGVYSTLPVLASYVPIIDGTKAGQQREGSYFQTNGNYGLRLVDMTTTTAIYKISLQIYWQDIFNNVYPLPIPNFQQANVTIGFINKSLYKHF